MTALRVLALALVLLAAAGSAAAQTCPSCGPNGAPDHHTSYSSAKAGANDTTRDGSQLVAENKLSTADKDHKNGWFAWWSFCLHGVVTAVDKIVGHKTGADASSQTYASEDGVDLDVNATVAGHTVDFDRSPVGKGDDTTWQAMAKIKSLLGIHRVPHPVGGEALPDATVNGCLNADVKLCPG